MSLTYRERVAAGHPSADPSNRRKGLKPKGICPVCGRKAPINKGRSDHPQRGPAAGTLGWHAPGLGKGRIECPGTGAEPVR
jgi:hypothetical protein